MHKKVNMNKLILNTVVYTVVIWFRRKQTERGMKALSPSAESAISALEQSSTESFSRSFSAADSDIVFS